MKVLYLLLLIAIPTWGLDRICSRMRCKLQSKDVLNLDSNRPRLIALELGSCQDNDLNTLLFTPNLRGLTVLHCESNFSTSHLAAPPNLDILRLRLGNVTELPLLGNMSQLDKLDLRRNRIERMGNGTFQGLTNLTELYLQDNLIRELPEAVFHPLKKLKLLDLSRNQISQLSSKFLLTGSELKGLYLRENPLVTLDFGFYDHPRRIDEIDLTDCREMRGFLDLPFKIHTLSLEGSGVEKVSADWLIELKAANSKVKFVFPMPYLKELDLRSTNLNWVLISNVFNIDMKTLETADLSNNSIGFLFEGDVWGKFRKLNLSWNELSILPPVFGDYLTSLDVSYNKIWWIQKEVFERAHNLESLFLQGNRISKLYKFDYCLLKPYNLKELALYDSDFNETFCSEMEEYFEYNTLTLHRSPKGYACRDPPENEKENSSTKTFV